MPFVSFEDLRNAYIAPLANTVQSRASFMFDIIEREKGHWTEKAGSCYAKAVDGVEVTKNIAATVVQPTFVVVETLAAKAQSARKHASMLFEQARESVDVRVSQLRSSFIKISSELQHAFVSLPVVHGAQTRVQSFASYVYTTGKQTEERAQQVRGMVHERVSDMVISTESLAWNLALVAKSNVQGVVSTFQTKVPPAVSNFKPELPEALNKGREQFVLAATNVSNVLGLDHYLENLQTNFFKVPVPVQAKS